MFDELTELLIKGQKEISKNQVFDALIEREKLGNTSIGNGIAVPKAHLPMTNSRAAILVVQKGLDLDAADKQPIVLFLAILIPDKLRDRYSLMLGTLNQKLILNGIPETVISSKNPELMAKYFDDLLYDDSQTTISGGSNDKKQNTDLELKQGLRTTEMVIK